jgi:hypothetical protein
MLLRQHRVPPDRHLNYTLLYYVTITVTINKPTHTYKQPAHLHTPEPTHLPVILL